jgi:hypothetical protein
MIKGKGKAVPLQVWSDPEGSRKLRFPDFMTTAQDGGKVVSFMHRPSVDSSIKMSIEQWWIDTETGKPTYSEQNLSRCHFAYNKS